MKNSMPPTNFSVSKALSSDSGPIVKYCIGWAIRSRDRVSTEDSWTAVGRTGKNHVFFRMVTFENPNVISAVGDD